MCVVHCSMCGDYDECRLPARQLYANDLLDKLKKENQVDEFYEKCDGCCDACFLGCK